MLTFISQIGLAAKSKGIVTGIMLSAASLLGEGGTTIPAKTLSFDASVYVTTQNKVRMAVEKTTPETLTLTVRDNQQQVVYSKQISKKDMKISVQFDMSELTDGKYELEVASKDGSIKKQVELKTATQQTARKISML
ncbi:DUF3244 domain-containing protein [Arsenicibacter rosenii]|uniref:Secretion system C-terminal sorting domain-containing protein n=1 Tax=Arsenicibacter rosenii TaxID=1750698 RepID=A0A1S2VER8_9BACT|nr:hypothetical protein [Arsenicibacter rosenii]OIN57202.1 hypothetical protein BLX24_20810 [Arsenicibacter rosenii]